MSEIPGLPDWFINRIKYWEGFKPKPYRDGAQFSSGYGTVARAGDQGGISEQEASNRLTEELAQARRSVDGFVPQNTPEGMRLALTSLTMNAGNKWMRDGLGDLVKQGNWAGAGARLQAYNKQGGQTLSGLVSRRAEEGRWAAGDMPPSTQIAEGNTDKGSPPSDRRSFASGSIAPAPQPAVPPRPPGIVPEAGAVRLGEQGAHGYARGNVAVEPWLVDTVQQASRSLPPGYRAEVISTVDARSTGTRWHPTGRAIDIQIYDDKGKPVPNIGGRDRPGYDVYENMAAAAKAYQQENYPDQKLTWGGHFHTGTPYDRMHFQSGGVSAETFPPGKVEQAVADLRGQAIPPAAQTASYYRQVEEPKTTEPKSTGDVAASMLSPQSSLYDKQLIGGAVAGAPAVQTQKLVTPLPGAAPAATTTTVSAKGAPNGSSQGGQRPAAPAQTQGQGQTQGQTRPQVTVRPAPLALPPNSYVDPNTQHVMQNPSGSGETAMGLVRDLGPVSNFRQAAPTTTDISAKAAAPVPLPTARPLELPPANMRATVPDILAPTLQSDVRRRIPEPPAIAGNLAAPTDVPLKLGPYAKPPAPAAPFSIDPERQRMSEASADPFSQFRPSWQTPPAIPPTNLKPTTPPLVPPGLNFPNVPLEQPQPAPNAPTMSLPPQPLPPIAPPAQQVEDLAKPMPPFNQNFSELSPGQPIPLMPFDPNLLGWQWPGGFDVAGGWGGGDWGGGFGGFDFGAFA